MPTYAYRGLACGHEFETIQKFADPPLTECIVCGGAVRRVVQPVGVVFKGSGWYITDSRSSKSSPAPSESDGSSPKPTTGNGKESGATPGGSESAAVPSTAEPAKSTAKSAD